MSVVLKRPPADEELIEQVEQFLQQWKNETGLAFRFSHQERDESGTVVTVWTAVEDTDLEIRLVFDDLAGVRYISASAPDKERRVWLFEQLRGHFRSRSTDELRASVEHEGDEDPAAYLRLALGLNADFDAQSLELVRKGLASSNVEVRASAAEAAAILGWSQLLDPVTAALQREADPGVTRVLEFAAQILQEAVSPFRRG